MASMKAADWRLFWMRVRQSVSSLFEEPRRALLASAAAADARARAMSLSARTLQPRTRPRASVLAPRTHQFHTHAHDLLAYRER
jgi:hypothetical protein